jgi:hypothetical protein
LTIWSIAVSRKSTRRCTWIGRSPDNAAPRATPVIAFSEIGVPSTRSGCVSPLIEPNTPNLSSASSPIANTRGSWRIAWSIASRIASQNVIWRPPVGAS